MAKVTGHAKVKQQKKKTPETMRNDAKPLTRPCVKGRQVREK